MVDSNLINEDYNKVKGTNSNLIFSSEFYEKVKSGYGVEGFEISDIDGDGEIYHLYLNKENGGRDKLTRFMCLDNYSGCFYIRDSKCHEIETKIKNFLIKYLGEGIRKKYE